MSIAEKFEVIADAVYEKGMENFENMLTNGYNRKQYKGTFSYSDFSGYTFKNTIRPVDNIDSMFYGYLGAELPQNISFENLNVNKSSTYYRQLFMWASKLTYIPDMSLPAIPYYTNTYSNCGRLKEIEVIRCNKNTVFNNPFSGCDNLTTFKIEGEIGTNFDCSQIPVSPETMISVINHLVDYFGTSYEGDNSVLFNEKCWEALEAYSASPSGSTVSWKEHVQYFLGWSI